MEAAEKPAFIRFKSVFAVGSGILCVPAGAGDPLVSYYGDRVEKMSPEQRAWAEARLGLDQPISTQYVRWLGQALKGDFGISYKYKMDVLEVISSRVGNTLILGGMGFLLIFVGSALLGTLCAWMEDRPLDKILCRVGRSSAASRNSGCLWF